MNTTEPLARLEEACTVVLVRDAAPGLEVLMLERPRGSSAFAGAWVFPGGKVDPEDRAGPDGVPLPDALAAKAAGVREVAEETGQRLEPGSLVPLSRWTPMQRIPRRFRTWFLLAAAPSSHVALNPGEHEAFAWLAPADVLGRHARGEMALVPPTWVTLHNLLGCTSAREALDRAAAAVPEVYDSHLLPDDAGTALGGRPAGIVWPGDEAYPLASKAGPAGARRRLYTSSLPWVFEHTGGTVSPIGAAE